MTFKPPVITPVRDDLPVPPKPTVGRAGKSGYPFDKLPVGGSFGVSNRTFKNMSSIVFAANKRAKTEKVFYIVKVDPASDPDNATVRVFREK